MGGTSRLWPEFQVTQYFDLPPKIAAKKRWRYIGSFTVCTKFNTKAVPPVFFSSEPVISFIMKLTYVMRISLIQYILSSTNSFIINTIFSTFAWDAVYRSCKTLWWSVVAVHSGCVWARRSPQNVVLGERPSGGQKDVSRRLLNGDWGRKRENKFMGQNTVC